MASLHSPSKPSLTLVIGAEQQNKRKQRRRLFKCLQHVIASDHLSSRLPLPPAVQHKIGVAGGVRFEAWPDSERLKLLEYLVSVYESP